MPVLPGMVLLAGGSGAKNIKKELTGLREWFLRQAVFDKKS
jgi:hypothetical protein